MATAHLYIINPLSGRKSMGRLFSTHPLTKDRVQRLRATEASPSLRARDRDRRDEGGSPFA